MDSDEVLLHKIREGDLLAFDVLYARHEAQLFGFLRAMLDRGDAEEVLQDAFMSVLKEKNAVFDREGAFRGWLYRVARNLALNRRRSGHRHDRKVAAAQTDDAAPAADEELESRQLEIALTAAVGRLPDTLGEMWHLRTSGLSYEQIASVIDVPLGTVKSRIHQMVNVLREELKPWIAPE